MKERILTQDLLENYHRYLICEEKSTATIEKYLRDTRFFAAYAAGAMVTKDLVVAYKEYLQGKEYAVRSINSMLASLNSLLDFAGWPD